MKEATNVNTGDVIQVQNASYEVLQVVPDAVYMFEEYGITAALVQEKTFLAWVQHIVFIR